MPSTTAAEISVLVLNMSSEFGLIFLIYKELLQDLEKTLSITLIDQAIVWSTLSCHSNSHLVFKYAWNGLALVWIDNDGLL